MREKKLQLAGTRAANSINSERGASASNLICGVMRIAHISVRMYMSDALAARPRLRDDDYRDKNAVGCVCLS
jgi:hypothetical protein